MANVRLDFSAPNLPDLAKLHIYEGTTPTGVFSEIEEVADIGDYPDYISYYTTQNAASVDNWFAIEWEVTGGAFLGLSQAVPGNAQTLVGKIVERVMLRDPSLDELIVTQEAETAVSMYFNTNTPLSVLASDTSLQILAGLVLLTIVMSSLTLVVAQGSSEDYTAGLVSQKSGTNMLQANRAAMEALLKRANELLGLNYTLVMLLEDIDPTGTGARSSIEWDQSRLLVTIE